MKNLTFRKSKLFWIISLFLAGFIVFLLLGISDKNELPRHAQFPGKQHTIIGKQEKCFDCHAGMTGFAPVHDPQVIGCTPCHLGDPQASKKRKAHRKMIAVPGNLEDAFLTCGTLDCHQDLAIRVKRSLMTSMSGVISVDRFIFGESESLDVHAHVMQLSEASPVDRHLRQLCASCHLGAKKESFGPITEHSRGGGCNACHLNYSEQALNELDRYDQNDEHTLPSIHPALNLQVSNTHCFGCHSRSGRISTNYEGWHETQLTEEEVLGKEGYRKLADGRVFRFVSPDVHHLAGIECIDCHSALEVMGDGTRHLHKEDAVRIRCEDCHFEGAPETVGISDLDEESRLILSLRKFNSRDHQFVVGHQDNPLWNVSIDTSGNAKMISKNSGEVHPLNPPKEVCSRNGAHQSLTCSACHTEWAPQCVGCHTAYEPDTRAFDLLDRKAIRGKWVEYLGEFFAEAPSLGVVEELSADSAQIRQIKTFIPGMIMTIDGSAFPGNNPNTPHRFHRLFAPGVAHTTNSTGRTCISCHNNPLALGYGRGQLIYEKDGGTGSWQFYPEYAASEYDQLPEDAWIGFMQEPVGLSATRSNARPFSIAEQKRILTVGACLTCHEEQSEIMWNTLGDYEGQLKKKSSQCVLPDWKDVN